MSLTDQQAERAVHELLTAAEEGITEAAANQALEELEHHQLSAALWELWEGGYTAISWTDDELCWRSIKPYRAAELRPTEETPPEMPSLLPPTLAELFPDELGPDV